MLDLKTLKVGDRIRFTHERFKDHGGGNGKRAFTNYELLINSILQVAEIRTQTFLVFYPNGKTHGITHYPTQATLYKKPTIVIMRG